MSIFFIRKLYPPIDHYYFLMRLSDWNKIYRPISLALFDVTTALSFFGEHKKTRELIELEVAKSVEQWNTTYGSLPLVRHIPYNVANNIFYIYVCVYVCVCIYIKWVFFSFIRPNACQSLIT